MFKTALLVLIVLFCAFGFLLYRSSQSRSSAVTSTDLDPGRCYKTVRPIVFRMTTAEEAGGAHMAVLRKQLDTEKFFISHLLTPHSLPEGNVEEISSYPEFDFEPCL